MLLPLLFFTQSKGGKSIKRCVHGISCWGDDLSSYEVKYTQKPKTWWGNKKIVRPNPEKWNPNLNPIPEFWLLLCIPKTRLLWILLSDYITRSEPRGGGTLKKNDPNSLHTWCWTLDTILRYVCTSMRIISFILQFGKIEKRSYKECNGILIRY